MPIRDRTVLIAGVGRSTARRWVCPGSWSVS